MSEIPESLQLEAIARVISPYQEKFGVPRQPGLVPGARGWLQMMPEFARPEAFDGLQGFSHIWVIFGFHLCAGQHRLRVRPPRLGGNREQGVFATRSPFRPNKLGLSVLRFEGLDLSGDGVRLAVSGLDLVDGSPIFDIKPYLPYSDCIPDALGGFAGSAPENRLRVVFAPEAERALESLPEGAAAARELIVQTLSLDPRPAYRGDADDRVYGTRLQGRDVRWRIRSGQVEVVEIVPLSA